VLHEDKHAEEHEVTCVAGKTFPPCNDCGTGVGFRMKFAARHVATHEHFKA
jgi:hypothetical protein